MRKPSSAVADRLDARHVGRAVQLRPGKTRVPERGLRLLGVVEMQVHVAANEHRKRGAKRAYLRVLHRSEVQIGDVAATGESRQRAREATPDPVDRVGVEVTEQAL